MSVATGTRVGPYEIVGWLGAGGMGEVYRARDPRLGREVAIKLIPESFAKDASRLHRFEQEARAAGQLNHPNILTVYDVGTHHGAPYVVSELLEGESLRSRLRGAPPARRKAIDYARQIADGLAAAHDKGIVHRDLKPDNLFVTSEGRLKILDFGLAKLTQPADDVARNTARLTETGPGTVLGTAGYMSPEQVRGETVDYRSDIFSFGAVVYEMLTGHPAFTRETAAETIAAILKEDPPEPLSATIPPALVRIVTHCLEKAREARFQSAHDLAFDLASLVRTTGAAPALVAPGRRVGMTVAALALAVAAVVGWSIWPRRDRTVAPSFTRVVRLTHTSAAEHGPAISRDGKWVAYLSDARGPVDIWVKFVAGGEASNLTARAGLDVDVRRNAQLEISPDGTAIAARVRTSSGVDTWLIPAPLPGAPRRFIEDAVGVRWSPDGRRVVYFRAGQTAGEPLFVADADGTNPVELVGARGGVHLHRPAWSHDGRYVYFVRTVTRFDQEPASIFRVAVTGGAIEPVIPTARRALDPLPMPDGAGLIYAANPTTADLDLWWRPLAGSSGAVRLTTGVGEYAEQRMSTDGRRMVATLLDVRQWLVSLPVPEADDAPSADLKTFPTDATMLTRGDTGDLDPALAPQGPNRLVFRSTRGGSRQLWTTLPDGSDPRPLTSGTALDEKPAVSRDGKLVAFISDRGGERGIWLIGIEGGTPQFLTPAIDLIDMLTWSPDGRQIAYSVAGGDLPELRVMSIADKRPRKLQTPGAASSPAWSPTRDVIAYLEPLRPNFTRVAFIDSRGHPLYANLPPASNVGVAALAWAPDGKRLASAAVEGLWIIEPDAPRPFHKLAKQLPAGQRLHGVAWTRDGSSVIVAIEETRGDLVLFERE
ncbi:MAG: protein kinase [Acidobacteriota bacterium]|nr:protein kinase [Acidobacteriota bacterium]MDQ5871506.1 protein kinase [Acidobacteriota bacterium]